MGNLETMRKLCYYRITLFGYSEHIGKILQLLTWQKIIIHTDHASPTWLKNVKISEVVISGGP